MARSRITIVAILVVVIVLVSAGALIYNYATAVGPKDNSPVKVTLVVAQTVPSIAYDIIVMAEFQVSNPGSQPVTFYGMLYSLLGDGENYDDGFIHQTESLAPGGHADFNYTFTAELSDTALDDPVKPSSMAWSLQGTMDVDTVSTNSTYPYTVDFNT